MNFECILLTEQEGVATLTLNRPERLNSFNAQMHQEMRDALKWVKKNSQIRCLLVTGAGRGFCAGQDLADRSFDSGEELIDLGLSLEKNYNPLAETISSFPVPTICAVNGVAAGAGANFALCFDIVIAAKSASFIQAFCKIGLVPDTGGTWTLTHAIGLPRARALALLGDKLSAEQAASWGMIWKCFDDEVFVDEANKLATQLSNQPTKGLSYIKRAFLSAPSNSLSEQLTLEQALQTAAGHTQDYREGVAAFTEKRPAKFKGY